jgi:hypothetical protein
MLAAKSSPADSWSAGEKCLSVLSQGDSFDLRCDRSFDYLVTKTPRSATGALLAASLAATAFAAAA